MLTFQVHDGGETHYHPLDGRPATIGGSERADIRLRDPGVSPIHARIEPIRRRGSVWIYKLVDLESEAGVRVNGERVAQVRLRLGDRVQIGNATLMLGQRVSRAATPADVLRNQPLRSTRRPARRSSKRAWATAASTAFVATALGIWFVFAANRSPARTEVADQPSSDQPKVFADTLPEGVATPPAAPTEIVEAPRVETEPLAETPETTTEVVPRAPLAVTTPPAEPTTAATREPTVDQRVAQLLADAHDAEAAGNLVQARSLLQQAAETVKAEDSNRARDLEGQATDMAHVHGLATLVSSRVRSGSELRIDLDGAPGRVVGAADSEVLVEVGQDTQNIAWRDLPASSLRDLVRELTESPHALLGAAVLAYRLDESALAETFLATAITEDESLERASWDLIRRWRPEPPDRDGYRLEDGRFVALREIRIRELAREIGPRLVAAMRKGSERDQLVEEVLDRNREAATDALIAALRRQHEALAAEVQSHPFRATWETLAARRRELDRARTTALATIFDETNYFYPYDGEGISAEQTARYAEVQQAVDERVEAVRAIWDDLEIRATVPADLADLVSDLRWTSQRLTNLAPHSPVDKAAVEWALALPRADGLLTIRTIAWTDYERNARNGHDQLNRWNESAIANLQPDEQQLVRLTNAYREMLGQAPLALNYKIVAAARGHCEEMEKFNYFGHMSPVRGRRTPSDRMAAAGYQWGSGENCAWCDTAADAHRRWLASSAHHRNLLSRDHSEFGVGGSGRYWTQNFGAGHEYRRHLKR